VGLICIFIKPHILNEARMSFHSSYFKARSFLFCFFKKKKLKYVILVIIDELRDKCFFTTDCC